jgi:hypothetical protein
MITFVRQSSGIYLPQGVEPADARVGFLFQDAGRTDPSFEFSEEMWRNPQSQGYFAFFAPAVRDWADFVKGVRDVFNQNAGAQFGWFTGSGLNAAAVSLIKVQRVNNIPRGTGAAELHFRQIVLWINPQQVGFGPLISFDDQANAFHIENISGSQRYIRLAVQPSGQDVQWFSSISPALQLPLTGEHAASVQAEYQFDTAQLAAFEAGMLYWPKASPPALQPALSYPLLCAPGGQTTPVQFSVWLDVLAPVDPLRSYFQPTDARVGSYLSSTAGQLFDLLPTNGTDTASTGRLVLTPRPVRTVNETTQYYLAPAGRFELALSADAQQLPSRGLNGLLCGLTGTEYLQTNAGTASSLPDALQFVPGKGAYAVGGSMDSTLFLDSLGGALTTSWVEFVTQSGEYVSEPQQTPLYQQNGGGQPLGASTLYLLDFKPLGPWSAQTASGLADAQVVSPAVPLAPYAGLPPATDLAPFIAVEGTALSPQRKQEFIAPDVPAAPRATAEEAMSWAMTPPGLLAGLSGTPATWNQVRMAVSPAGILEIDKMGTAIRNTLLQNQIFAVISTSAGGSLFNFAQSTVTIGDWTFDLSPDGLKGPNDRPPILLFKFYRDRSIGDLVNSLPYWSYADTFNQAPFTATDAQQYLQELIQAACEDVYHGNCPGGTPGAGAQPDQSSLYYPFYQAVTDPNFSGILAVNCNLKLNALPLAVQGVLGGMKDLAAFRAHHVGIRINNTNASAPQPELAQSSFFALVDYEDPGSVTAGPIDIEYNFVVEYLRALFTNSELRQFSSKINLTINNLFDAPVTLTSTASSRALTAGSNTIAIIGSYQAHSTTGDQTSSGQGVYSFIAEGAFTFNFDSKYLQSITLTKVQFSFQNATPAGKSPAPAGETSRISAGFALWGNMVFKELDVLDFFSFEKLSFADLGIDVGFDLRFDPPQTSNLSLSFSPGNLRFDLAQTTTKQSSNSMLSLLPFRLKSFLYSQHGDQSLESLNYFPFSILPGHPVSDTFSYALIFDLDLGSLGALVGSLAAFKFSIIVGWLNNPTGDDLPIAFGVQLPQANGKLEITIEGVLSLVIQHFTLQYVTPSGSGAADDERMLVVGLQKSHLQVLGVRMPPGEYEFDFALFAPLDGAARIGWLAAVEKPPPAALLPAGSPAGSAIVPAAATEGAGPVFELVYLGGGQRVGPQKPPTTFKEFLDYMTGDFWTAVQEGKYREVYDPNGDWLVLADFKLLQIIEVGFVFYDITPFYSLTLSVEKLFSFEITYTKISDTIGLFYASLTLPDNLRTFQVGAASLTLPALGVSVYTNGNWKLDVGFPQGDNWSRSFRVEAQAGPVPITGSGGFYIASLSSATNPVFKGNYPSILAFGLAVRLGVGKDFTAGPLKAGISVTFFGIVEGAAGYLSSGSEEIFSEPDALWLKGQLGIIGELYGSIDFKIIKASVNVTLSASIGAELLLEQGVGGSLLLYVQASVQLSVEVTIDLFLFSVTVSFSFNATFRFEWQLLAPKTAGALVSAAWEALMVTAPAPLLLCPGLDGSLQLWYLPEVTVVFPDAAGKGVPWFVCSLGIEYNSSPPVSPTAADYKSFDTLIAQLVTWTLANVLSESGCSFPVSQRGTGPDDHKCLAYLDQHPEEVVGWIGYSELLAELSTCFTAAVGMPGGSMQLTAFPMIPFLQLQTAGRLDGAGNADDLTYQFSAKNNVAESYLQLINEYFNKLFVNQAADGAAPAAVNEDLSPLAEDIFLDYFTGLIRGAVHELLQRMQDDGTESSPLNELILAAFRHGQFMTLAGQMSSSFRGGVRLPYTDGLTIPAGQASTDTNPLYALLWQEFPVGSFATSGEGAGSYTVTLTNPDTTQQPWVTTTAGFTLTATAVQPYTNLTPQAAGLPGAPAQLPFTNSGPQAFAFSTSITWTGPQGTASLRAFPSNLQALQATLGGTIDLSLKSRETNGAYQPNGTLVPPGDFAWATAITLSVRQVPDESGKPLADIYSLSGASQQDQALLQAILSEAVGSIASIQILYQTAAGASGLTSAAINPTDVFLLRTNTTTVSAPPAAMMLTAAAGPQEVPVGATIDQAAGFLQIVEQAVVTNAPGYYLRYQDKAGKNLPPELFSAGPAPLTLLITYSDSGPAQVAPYSNTLVLYKEDSTKLYCAETTNPSLDVQYPAVAPGSVGMLLTRNQSAMTIAPPARLMAAADGAVEEAYTRGQLLDTLRAAGITADEELHQLLVEADAPAAQVAALYSLVTYRVEQSTGFIESPLSAPIQPQQPTGGSSTLSYRVFAPLYKLATGNQIVLPDGLLNRYASLGDSFGVDFFLNDAFGNQIPLTAPFKGDNLYFDPIVPVDHWQGVVTAYDFLAAGGAQPGVLTVHLQPSEQAFAGMTADQRAAALTLYGTIRDQINGPGISFSIETNLALQADGQSMVQIALSETQVQEIDGMVQVIITYLEGPSPLPPLPAVDLSVTVTGPGALPPAFELAVLLGIERDPALISPLLKQDGIITFPSAQNVSSAIAPTAGAQWPPTTQQSLPPVPITDFAANFAIAFPALALSVGLTGAQSPQTQASASRAHRQLRAAGLPTDGSTGETKAGPQSLWAVQRTLLDITIGQTTGSGPFYSGPKPMDNTLNTAIVPLPVLTPPLTQLPASQLFTDIDLDVFGRSFFQAVDDLLSPQPAALAFEQARAAYTAIAEGREQLAGKYSDHEVYWMFPGDSPFTGTSDDLTAARKAFAEQMRASLMTAYAVDTIVQYTAAWSTPPPSAVGDQYELFGMVQRVGQQSPMEGFGLSTAHLPVVSGGSSLLTFLYGTNQIQDEAEVTLDLEYNVTHVQYFTEPKSETPPDEARPSIWLQLVNPYQPGKLPHIGTGETTIPLVLRQYPTPPTFRSQKGEQGKAPASPALTGSSNPFIEAAAWHYIYEYQAQLTAHDQLLTTVTYNTDLSASGTGQPGPLADSDQAFTLFQALARFSAAFTVLQPVLQDLKNSNWARAIGDFAELVTAVVNNTTWNDVSMAAVARLANVVDRYTVTDLAQENSNERLITLTWDAAQGESHFAGVQLAIWALDPNGNRYRNQQQGTIDLGITDRYDPVPPIDGDWVTHQVVVKSLSVLVEENALAGMQIERNVISLPGPGDKTWQTMAEFIYKTPLVRPSQPVTPFVDSDQPIDVAQLPGQGQATGCGSTSPANLCQRIYTMMSDLLTDPDQLPVLRQAQMAAGMSDDVVRSVQVACNLRYPLAEGSGATAIEVDVPILFARSFSIDVTQPEPLNAFASAFAGAIEGWSTPNGVSFGSNAQPAGGMLVFDVTLYAELSSVNTPVLRLRNVQLKLPDVEVS